MRRPEGRGGEAVEDPAVDLLLVGAVLVVQAELGDGPGPQDGGEPLREGDVLQLGSDQPPGLLVHQLVQRPGVTHLNCYKYLDSENSRYTFILLFGIWKTISPFSPWS